MSGRLFVPVLFCVLIGGPTSAPAQSDAPQNSSWVFSNWNTPNLPWTTYRRTFTDIPPAEDPLSSAFDVLFYNGVYSSLASTGNCYGMSLMSLLMIRDGGQLGYCLPVSQYSGDPTGMTGPTDPMLATAINIMHGRQLTLPSVQFMLDVFANHTNRDTGYAFDQYSYWKSRGDYTLVSITKSLNPQDGGHTLVAYGVVDQGSGNRQILVYDPNRPYATNQSWYSAANNVIQISGQSWSYAPNNWSGSPSGGGNLVITPVSIGGPEARSPASLGDQIIGQLVSTLILTGDGALLQQITDGRGKRLYKPGTMELDTDPATGMRNTLPLFLSDGGQASSQATVLMHFGTSGGALTVSVRAGSPGYVLKSVSSRTLVSVAAHGGNGTEVITLRYPTTREAAVELKNSRKAQNYDVEFTRAEIPHQRVNILSASHVTVGANVPIELGLQDRARALQVISRSAPTHYDYQLRTVTRSGQDVSDSQAVDQDAGTTQTIRPVDWRNLKAGSRRHVDRLTDKASGSTP